MTVERRLAFWRVTLGAAVAFAVTMALLPKPPELPIDGLSDKWEHMLAFATLALLAALAYPAIAPVRIGERLSFLGALIEIAQSIPALNRDCDIRDWIADTFAIVVVLSLVALVRRRRVAP